MFQLEPIMLLKKRVQLRLHSFQCVTHDYKNVVSFNLLHCAMKSSIVKMNMIVRRKTTIL